VALLALGDDAGADLLLDDSDKQKEWAQFTWFGPAMLRLPDSPAARQVKARATVEALMPAAKSDPGQLVIISDALRLLGTDPARERLRDLTGHLSRYVRGRAAMNLAASGTRADLARVAAMADDDPTWFARTKAAQAMFLTAPRRRHLWRYADQVARAVTEAPEAFDRAAALDSLGIIARAQDVPLAAARLADADAYVRLCAAEALGRIGTAEAIAAVRNARADADLRVRLQAETILAART
jgi:HEAT repeat protein